MKATLREAFEKSAQLHQETLERAAIGHTGAFDAARGGWPEMWDELIGEWRTWENAAPILDQYSYNSPIPVYAWSATRVYFVHEYDASFEIFSLPLKPTREAPHYCGHQDCWWSK